jgi:hypothetical protein
MRWASGRAAYAFTIDPDTAKTLESFSFLSSQRIRTRQIPHLGPTAKGRRGDGWGLVFIL